MKKATRKIDARLLLEGIGFPEDDDPGPLFGEYAKTYLDLRAAATLKPSTVEGYRFEFARHLKPAFGQKRLKEITRADVKAFVAGQVTKGLSAASVRKHVSNLRALLSLDDNIP